MVRTREDEIFKALASPVRRKILDALKGGPSSTGELAQHFPALTRFAVMQHLGVLERAGLVLVRRESRKRLNFLNAVPIRQVYERWVEEIAGKEATKATSLRRHTEGG